jgi:hypothetical protein
LTLRPACTTPSRFHCKIARHARDTVAVVTREVGGD